MTGYALLRRGTFTHKKTPPGISHGGVFNPSAEACSDLFERQLGLRQILASFNQDQRACFGAHRGSADARHMGWLGFGSDRFLGCANLLDIRVDPLQTA